MTEATLREHLAYWQGQLGLAAWTVEVVPTRRWEMPVPGTAGCCTRTICDMTATVYLLDERDRPDGYDAEQVLVHELLHVYHHVADTTSAVDMLVEQGVEMTARALVRLRREEGVEAPG